MCYSEFATMIPVAGSAYTYAYATLGELLAWIIGWDLVLEYAVGAATVSVSWSSYVVKLLHMYGVELPQSLTRCPWDQPAGLINLPAVLIIFAVSVLLMIGISESAKVNGVIVAIKLTIVIIVICVGFAYINRANYTPFIPPNTGKFGEFGWSGIMRAAAVIFFAYIGFDAVSTAAQEARRPQRDMPIGIIGSLAICTILYVLFAHVLTGMVPYTKFHGDAAPVATVISLFPHAWLQTGIVIGIIAGYTSVILVILLGRPSEVADALPLQHDLHGVCLAIFGLPADFAAGPHDQHRDAARVCDRVHRGDGDAEDQPPGAAPLPYAAGAAGAGARHTGLPGDDGFARRGHVVPAGNLAGYRTDDLLHLQPAS
jgi:amino acid transporter